MKTRATTEEDVKYAYTKKFNLDFSTRNRNDLITDNVLFEFKYNKKLTNEVTRSIVIAQSLIYIHRIKYDNQNDKMPAYFVIADKNEAIIYKTIDFRPIYDNDKFNWDIAASHPPEDLCIAIHTSNVESLIYNVSDSNELKEFSDKLNKILDSKEIGDKKIITEYNFDAIFEIWKSRFGEFIDSGKKLSKFFISDILGNTTLDKKRGTVIFRFNSTIKEVSIPVSDYKAFWNTYHYMDDAIAQQGMYSKSDRLDNIDKRRFIGKFYTPLRFAKLAIKYLENEYGKRFWERYKIWDMACGTGNLEYYLGNYENVYMSTLEQNEIDDMMSNNLFPSATLFQYDYLNDDVDLVMNKADLLDDSLEWKLPRKLREDLANPDNKWIVLINPPFAAPPSGVGNVGKSDVTNTKIRNYLIKKSGGWSAQELFTQFIFRIVKELNNSKLGIFSALKYINGTQNEKFKENVFKARYENGFVFPAFTFHGTSGKWPIAFAIWFLGKKINLKEQSVTFDVYDENEKIGCKKLTPIDKQQILNKWIVRLKPNKEFPAFTNAINIRSISKIVDKSIGTIRSRAGDIMHQNLTYFHSAIITGGNIDGYAITKKDFEKCMILNAVRLIPKSTWLNNKDQFKQPTVNLDNEFIRDSVAWSLFNSSNQSSAIKDIELEGKIFQVRNQFYPFNIEEVKQWSNKNLQIYSQLRNEEERFVAKWLSDKELSKEAQSVLEVGRCIYKLYYKEYNNLNKKKFKLDYWDVGWYQIRKSLEDKKLGTEQFKKFKEEYKILTEKLRPKIYEYGFLDKEIIYE